MTFRTRANHSFSPPILTTIREYDRDSLRYDLVAGVVLATMLIPQGMAYAELTGLPAITGIYTTIAALVAYSIFGPNRSLILGPDSSLAPVIAAVVLPLAAGDTGTAVLLASALSLVAGVTCIAAGYLRLGVITELLSKPIRIGYLNGIAVIVLISQLPKALGFSVEGSTTVEVIIETARGVANGDVVPSALVLSFGSVATIVLLRRINRRIPGIVVAAAGSIAAVALLDLGVAVVGDIPAGIPPLRFPGIELGVLPALIGGALAVALVSFADTGALSTATSLKAGQHVDPNSEIKALGAANIVSGLFQGFPTSASSSRTAVAIAMRAQTQIAGLVAAAGVIAVMFLFPDFISQMPSATLAAIVITASFTLFDLKDTRWILKARRSEFIMLAGAFLSVVFIGILEGIAVAILLSVGNFVRKAWRPHSTELGKVKGTPGFHDIERHPEAEVVPGLLMVRFDAPLFFANAPEFGRRLQDRLRNANREIDTIIVVGNAITDIDTTGAEILGHILEDLETKGIHFAFAGLKGPVKDRLRSYELYDRVGNDFFYPNTISAVKAYKKDAVKAYKKDDDEKG